MLQQCTVIRNSIWICTPARVSFGYSGRFSDILLTGNIKLAARCDKHSRKHDWKSDVVSPAKAGHNKTTKTSVSLKQYTDVVDHVSSTNTFMSFTWLFYCLICGTVNLFSGLSQTLGLRNWQQHGLFLSVSYFSHIKVCLALFWS